MWMFPRNSGCESVCVLCCNTASLHYKFGRELLHIPSLPCLIDIHSFSSGLNVAVCTGEKVKITRQRNNRRRRWFFFKPFLWVKTRNHPSWAFVLGASAQQLSEQVAGTGYSNASEYIHKSCHHFSLQEPKSRREERWEQPTDQTRNLRRRHQPHHDPWHDVSISEGSCR